MTGRCLHSKLDKNGTAFKENYASNLARLEILNEALALARMGGAGRSTFNGI